MSQVGQSLKGEMPCHSAPGSPICKSPGRLTASRRSGGPTDQPAAANRLAAGSLAARVLRKRRHFPGRIKGKKPKNFKNAVAEELPRAYRDMVGLQAG